MMLIMTMIVVVPRIILLEHRLMRSREGPGGATISTILNFLKG